MPSPHSTVPTEFKALGRVAAEQLLVEIRDGRAVQSRSVVVTATVPQGRSCGCLTLDERLAADDADYAATSWQASLLRQLVQVIRYPLPLDPTALPGPATASDDTDWDGALYRAAPPLTRPAAVKAIPYYAWDHCGPGRMRVWLHETGE